MDFAPMVHQTVWQDSVAVSGVGASWRASVEIRPCVLSLERGAAWPPCGAAWGGETPQWTRARTRCVRVQRPACADSATPTCTATGLSSGQKSDSRRPPDTAGLTGVPRMSTHLSPNQCKKQGPRCNNFVRTTEPRSVSALMASERPRSEVSLAVYGVRRQPPPCTPPTGSWLRSAFDAALAIFTAAWVRDGDRCPVGALVGLWLVRGCSKRHPW
eukprot:1827213-Prymnesium_polylepis.2